jgi:hypothetical protein
MADAIAFAEGYDVAGSRPHTINIFFTEGVFFELFNALY